MPKTNDPAASITPTRAERPGRTPPPLRRKLPDPQPEHISQSDSSEQLVGVVLDENYRIIKEIGSGGMGKVYLAAHTKIAGKMAAIKVLERAPGLFQKEALAALKIGHDNIVGIYGYGTTVDGKPYLAMEYLEGMDLSGMLEDKKRLSWPVARDMILQVCDALYAAHQRGVVHLDMKPMNVFLVNRAGKQFVKVLDFGISQLSEEVAGIGPSPTRGFIGTPYYAPPEQFHGSKECDHRSDIYAVGVMLYEMLCGSLPFVSNASGRARVKEIMLMHENTPPPPFSVHVPAGEMPDGAEAVVMRCLAKKKDDRFPSMAELAQALVAVDRHARDVPNLDIYEYDPRPPRNRKEPSSVAGWMTATLVAAAMAGGFWVYHKGSGDGTLAPEQDAQPALAVKPDASVEHAPEKKQSGKKPQGGHGKSDAGHAAGKKPHAKKSNAKPHEADPSEENAASPEDTDISVETTPWREVPSEEDNSAPSE